VIDSFSYDRLHLDKLDKINVVQTAVTCRHPVFQRSRTDEKKITAFLSRSKDRSLLFFYQNGEDDDYNQLKKYFLEYLIFLFFFCDSKNLSTDVSEKRNLRHGDISQ